MHLYRSPSAHLKAGWELTTLRGLTMMSAASDSSRCGCCSSPLRLRTPRRGAARGSPSFLTELRLSGTRRRSRESCRLRYGLHRPQKENVSGNSDQQEDACCGKGPKKRMRRLHDVAGRDGCGNAGDLIAKVQDSADGAYAFFGCD